MEIAKKIGLTVAAFFVLGLIVTALYEKGGVAPGDGMGSFILLIFFIIALVFIWSSGKKKNEQGNSNDQPKT